MSHEIDYAVILAFLEAKKLVLEKTIAGILEIIGQEAAPVGAGASLPPAPSVEEPSRPAVSGAPVRPQDIAPGTFHGLSVSEAARRFLLMTKQKQKMADICDALKSGGIESTARNFYSNVYSTLMRQGAFIRLGTYWGLAEWYPNRATGGPTVPRKGARKKGAQKAARKATRKTAERSPEKAESKSDAAATEGGRVRAFVKKKRAPQAAAAE